MIDTTKYYIIKQSVPYLKPKIIKIGIPCNLTHLKKFISFMFGKIEVYIYDDLDNSRIDVSKEFGVLDFNIYDYPFEKIFINKFRFVNKIYKDIYFEIFSIKELHHNDFENFFMSNNLYKFKTLDFLFSNFFSCSIDEHKKNINVGSIYESFISKKYVDLGYEVLLNGINKSFDDGGIDIIATKDNNVVLIQCKNWILSNSYKINQKDLRAFIGDCFLYIKKNKYFDKKISYHFIVSHDNILTGSAEIFLKENSFIKFKCVPFEKI
ncbi:restriction endonuclease [Arcobacter aquimarinus]|uniref:restriction endonuclease n=1 Tax=Arcobacter aquimarinus TaxID=1315211 RepID=UPI003BAF46E6